MVSRARVLRAFAGQAMIIATGAFLAAYVVLQYSGLFAPPPVNMLRVFHAWPALAGAGMIVLSGASGLWLMHVRGTGATGRGLGYFRSLMGFAGLLLTGAGILISSLTRFEGSVVLHEGQETVFSSGDIDERTVYRRRYARMPEGVLVLQSIAPFPGGTGDRALDHSAVVHQKAPSSPNVEMHLGSQFSSRAGGFSYRIGEVGYSPHFFLFDLAGDLIQDVYAIMRLFPPGAEDSFRFDKIIPHTFYLSYYPDVSAMADRPDDLSIPSGPVYKLRIVRNLELLVDKYAAPDDLVRFDALLVSVGDVRRWVEIRIVRDPGLSLLLPGLVLGAVSAALFPLDRSRLHREGAAG